MKPFQLKNKVEPSFIESIFKVDPKFNAVIEINNLLATRQICEVQQIHIEEIGKRYKLNIRKTFREHFQNLYSRYLNYCFQDHKLSSNEIADLNHLKKILYLTDKETAKINKMVGEKIFIEETQKAIIDGRLTEEEKAFLEELKNELSIPETTAKKIYTQLAENYFNDFFSRIISDERISIEEENELEEIANSLGLAITMNDKARSSYDKMKLLWLIENDSTPEISVEFQLNPGEAFYFRTPCLLMEEAIKIKGGGSEVLLEKIVNGYNIKVYNASIKPEDTLRYEDKGTLYLSNQRMIFRTTNSEIEINLDRIIDLTPYSNGIEVRHEGEKSTMLFFNFQEHLEVFVALISLTFSKMAFEKIRQ